MRNGYVILPRDASEELPFPEDPSEKESLLKQTKVLPPYLAHVVY